MTATRTSFASRGYHRATSSPAPHSASRARCTDESGASLQQQQRLLLQRRLPRGGKTPVERAHKVRELGRELARRRARADDDERQELAALVSRERGVRGALEALEHAVADLARVVQVFEVAEILPLVGDARRIEGVRLAPRRDDEKVVRDAERAARVVEHVGALDGPRLGVDLERFGLVVLAEPGHRANRFLDRPKLERADGRRRQQRREEEVVARAHDAHVELGFVELARERVAAPARAEDDDARPLLRRPRADAERPPVETTGPAPHATARAAQQQHCRRCG
mmetsp:Transcript_8731/g.36119  ORF Transcript_8731/g.36119 Transcript_8731/m.36119 type:complete len:284 (-) Transcript_8731:62-913(-)